MAQSIGAVLKAARARSGMTQSEVARSAGVTPNIVSRLEAGERATPAFTTVARVAAALGVSLDAIAGAIGVLPAVPDRDPTVAADLLKVRRSIAEADGQLEHILGRIATAPKRRKR